MALRADHTVALRIFKSATDQSPSDFLAKTNPLNPVGPLHGLAHVITFLPLEATVFTWPRRFYRGMQLSKCLRLVMP